MSAPPLSDSEFGTSQASSPSSPSIEIEYEPSSAQHAQGYSHETDSGLDANFQSESETGSGDSDEQPHIRPNRFAGRADRWKYYVAEELQLADYLEQLQNRDLAAHLYNAHALKRKARLDKEDLSLIKTWQGRNAWLKSGNKLQFTDISGSVQRHLIPARIWTAWPLPPEALPSTHEPSFAAQRSQRSGWVIENTSSGDMGGQMQEELLAIFLRLAKEHLLTRGNFAVLADDTIAFGLLQPTINSILDDLDTLALAIYRTRLNHCGSGIYERFSQSELTSGAESTDATFGSKPGPFEARTRKSRNRKRSSSAPAQPDSDNESLKAAQEQKQNSLGLMDWSDVLGLAAIRGWNQGAIARTAQRCAALFQESMSFIPLDADPIAQAVPDPVLYTPSTIPSPNGLVKSSRTGLDKCCPHTGCYANKKKLASLKRHMREVHGYDYRTNDSDNADRTDGGVHVDGYLKPVIAQKERKSRSKSGGERGSNRKKQKVDHEYALTANEALPIDTS